MTTKIERLQAKQTDAIATVNRVKLTDCLSTDDFTDAINAAVNALDVAWAKLRLAQLSQTRALTEEEFEGWRQDSIVRPVCTSS